MNEEFKRANELLAPTLEMIHNWNEEIIGEVYLVKRQVLLRCPRSGRLIQESYCLECDHNFGQSSKKWIYCLPETKKNKGKRK